MLKRKGLTLVKELMCKTLQLIRIEKYRLQINYKFFDNPYQTSQNLLIPQIPFLIISYLYILILKLSRLFKLINHLTLLQFTHLFFNHYKMDLLKIKH